jgi:hypothetical protein
LKFECRVLFIGGLRTAEQVASSVAMQLCHPPYGSHKEYSALLYKVAVQSKDITLSMSVAARTYDPHSLKDTSFQCNI